MTDQPTAPQPWDTLPDDPDAIPFPIVVGWEALPDAPALIEVLQAAERPQGMVPGCVRYWPEDAVELDEFIDVTAEFPDGVNVGDCAAIPGPLVLAEIAERVES